MLHPHDRDQQHVRVELHEREVERALERRGVQLEHHDAADAWDGEKARGERAEVRSPARLRTSWRAYPK